MPTVKIDELRALISDLHATLNQIYQIDDDLKVRNEWPADHAGSILHPPATEDQISRFERKTKHPLPPSYRAFLSLHNGWEHCWGDVMLTGVKGPHTERFLEDVTEYAEMQQEDVEGEVGKPTPAAVAKWESLSVENLYLRNHIPFATTFGGEFWVFDTRTRQPDGEMTVAYWTIDAGVWEDETQTSFSEFLRSSLDGAREQLELVLEECNKKSLKTGTRAKSQAKRGKK